MFYDFHADGRGAQPSSGAGEQTLASLPPWLEPQVRISHPRSNKEASLCLPTPSFWGRQEPCHPLEKPTYSCPQEPFKGVKKKKKVFIKHPDGSDGKESSCNVVPSPGLGRTLEGGYGNPLQYSCLENPMDRGAWWATVHRGHKESDMTEQLNTA